MPIELQKSAEELAFELLTVLPKVAGSAAAEAEPEGGNQRTLVLEPGPAAPPEAPAAPRPAAGVPAQRPGAGGPAAAPARSAASAAPGTARPGSAARAGAGGPAATARVPSPAKPEPPAFPTLNIEIGDDLLPQLPTDGAASVPAASTDPAPTRRADAPPVRGVAPRVPVVRAGEGAPLAQTMESASVDIKDALDDEDEEAATMVKSPTEADKARVSLAEEAMVRALGAGLPKVGGNEGFEATLINAEPPPGAVAAAARASSPSDPPLDLKNLKETLKVDPEDAERAILDALSRGSNPPVEPGKAPTPAPSPPPPEDRPARKPTSELIPVSLNADKPPVLDAAPAPLASDPGAAVWQPKGRKLGGATALIVGIVIGALLVAIALAVILLLKSPA